jgi:O-antigen/teichoic acid export membrane protein
MTDTPLPSGRDIAEEAPTFTPAAPAEPKPPGRGVGRRRIAANMVWSWAGMLAELVTAFLIAPYLVKSLGEHDYGIWILLGSVVGYMGLLDFGIRGAVARYVAFYRAKDDPGAVRAVVWSGLRLTAAGAAVVILAAIGIDRLFVPVFHIPSDSAHGLRLAVWLMMLNIAVMLPLNLLEAILWGAQRFDRIYQLNIPATVCRLLASYWVVQEGWGLVGLAASSLGLTLLLGVARFVMVLRVEPCAFSRGEVNMAGMSRTLLSYSLPAFATNLTGLTRLQFVPAGIGLALGPTAVTHYSLSRRLLDYNDSIVFSMAGVFAPTFASLQASGSTEHQVALFKQGGRFSMALALLLTGLLLVLGRPFLMLWLGPQWGVHARLLWILALGEALPLSQLITSNMLLGLARHRRLAVLLAAEVAVVLPGVWMVSSAHGLFGICVVLALAGALFRGLLVLRLGCRVLEIPLAKHVARNLAPAIATSGAAVAGLALLAVLVPPSSWLFLVIDLAGYGALAVGSLLVLGGREMIDAVRRVVATR